MAKNKKVKKMKTIVKRNIVLRQKNDSRKLPTSKKLGFSKYVLPKMDNVPAGDYYSMIENVENSVTRRQEKAITVYYRISPRVEIYKKANNLLPKGTKVRRYFIRQIYPIGSSYYDAFITAMHDELGKSYDEGIDFDEIIGLTELIILSYEKLDGIGGISQRCYYEDEDFINPSYSDNQNSEISDEGETSQESCSNSLDDDIDEDNYEDFDFDCFDD